ncbi:hypothetical protein D9M68_757410 [compost metagenome]
MQGIKQRIITLTEYDPAEQLQTHRSGSGQIRIETAHLANALGYLHEVVMVVVSEYKCWRSFAAISTLINQRCDGNLVSVDSTHHLPTPLLLSIDVPCRPPSFVGADTELQGMRDQCNADCLDQRTYARTIRTPLGRNAIEPRQRFMSLVTPPCLTCGAVRSLTIPNNSSILLSI